MVNVASDIPDRMVCKHYILSTVYSFFFFFVNEKVKWIYNLQRRLIIDE